MKSETIDELHGEVDLLNSEEVHHIRTNETFVTISLYISNDDYSSLFKFVLNRWVLFMIAHFMICSVEHQYLQIMVESCCLIDFSLVYICVCVFVVNFLYFFYFYYIYFSPCSFSPLSETFALVLCSAGDNLV